MRRPFGHGHRDAVEPHRAADALIVLTERNSFLHIAAYRKLFSWHKDGLEEGKFIALDLADLVDLDELDCEIHRVFLSLANDVERIAKTQLLVRISEQDGEDGCSIVAHFIEGQDAGYRKTIKRDLECRRGVDGAGDAYSGALIDRYGDAMLAWVFLEVVPFGTLLAFMLHCVRPVAHERSELLDGEHSLRVAL